MDFKIELLCSKCKCSCELRPEEFKARTSMECPNCGQALPADVYNDLKAGVEALGRAPERISENATNPFSEDLFTVRVKSFGTLHNLLDNRQN